MKITASGASQRPAFYDRNPTMIATTFKENVSAAPHGTTQQWLYTVPTGRKAMVQYGHALAARDTVATTVGVVLAYVNLNPAATYAGPLARLLNNAAASEEAFNGPVQAVILTGNQVAGYDGDGSTGGTADEWEDAFILEFDA